MSNIRRPKEGRDMQDKRTLTSLPGWFDGLYDPDEMRAADRFAMERRGILELELAEKAGVGLAAAAAGVAGGGPIRVVVGPGNNGGDGLISARLLREAGHEVDVIAPLALEGLAGVPRTNLDRLPGAPPRPFDPAALVGSGAIVDALLGTGFEGVVREPLLGVIAAINDAGAPVIAAEVPSGVNAATGEVEGPAIRASVTTTNHAPKIGLYVARGSPGAPGRAGGAAMRAAPCYGGAAVPASVVPVMDLRLPEALIHGLEEEDGRHVEASVRTIAALAPEAGAVVLGPGLGGAE